MKLNFGHGILIFILLFMTGILFLVFKCSKQKEDLVSTTYYEQELKYGDQIAKEKNSLGLADNVKVAFDKQHQQVVLTYPSTADSKLLGGNIRFYKPDNAAFDFSKTVAAGIENKQTIEASSLAHGYWDVQVSWNNGSTPYYYSAKILID